MQVCACVCVFELCWILSCRHIWNVSSTLCCCFGCCVGAIWCMTRLKKLNSLCFYTKRTASYWRQRQAQLSPLKVGGGGLFWMEIYWNWSFRNSVSRSSLMTHPFLMCLHSYQYQHVAAQVHWQQHRRIPNPENTSNVWSTKLQKKIKIKDDTPNYFFHYKPQQYFKYW